MSDAADREIARLEGVVRELRAQLEQATANRYAFDRYQESHRRMQQAEGKLARLEARQDRLTTSWQRLEQERRTFHRTRDQHNRGRSLEQMRRDSRLAFLEREHVRLTEAGAALARQLAGVTDG